MSKFVKVLILINGLILPLFFCFLIYKILTESNKSNERGYEAESIIVGEELEDAKKDSLAPQGITYEQPQEIYNSTNYYLPLSALTFEEARDVRRAASSAGDISLSFYNYFNVIFLDKDYKVIGKLLDKKASISEIDINTSYNRYDEKLIDTTVKNISYLIGFEDSNKDSKLNSLDFHDLYVSDLQGRNLVQVTSNKQIVDYNFINSNAEIFIRFKERNGLRDEYNYVKFGIYDIAKKSFRELKDIETQILEIEKQLIR